MLQCRVKIPGIPSWQWARRGGEGSAIISATINPTAEFLIEDLNRSTYNIIIYLFFFPPFPVPGPPLGRPPLAITAAAGVEL